MLVPVSSMVTLASVELSGELMQEIYDVQHLKALETTLYLVLTLLKAFLPCPIS